ncbi:MAG TPA: HAD family acid phosphatase [Baekduia sp.]
MRHAIALLTAAAALSFAPAAVAQNAADQIPPPQPITTTIGSTPLVELSDGGGGLPYLGSSTSYNAGALTTVLAQYHDTGVYDREIAQIDAVAQQWIAKQGHERTVAAQPRASKARTLARAAHKNGDGGKGHRHGGAKPRGGKPGDGHHGGGNWWNKKLAIVLDIDETALSNYSAIVADGFVYGPKSQAEATDEIGVAIKPTLDLVNLARARGIDVFFITGRPEAQRAVTAENLTREGFTDYQGLDLKPAGFTGTTVAYKSGARAAIEQQGYRIVASVGDQYSDLAGGHEDRAFKLPNPFYFLP